MPTYGYECKSCRHTFDAFQNMADEPLKTCPECGKAIRRLINGGSGIIFKGRGFYVTDKGGSSAKGASSANKASDTSKANGDATASGDGKTAESVSAETKTAGTDGASSSGASTGAAKSQPAAAKMADSA